jgi:hypothetical protein
MILTGETGEFLCPRVKGDRFVEIAAEQMAARHAVVGVSNAYRLTDRLGDRERGGQTVERHVELAVVDVCSRDASENRRRNVFKPRGEQIQCALVVMPRILPPPGTF